MIVSSWLIILKWKKIILVFVEVVITGGANEQAGSTNRKMSPQDMNNTQKQNLQSNPGDKLHPDGVMMQNGEMMVVKYWKMASLDLDMTMSNGTKILRDETCIKKGGTKVMLKEGQHLDMSGNMISKKTNKGWKQVSRSRQHQEKILINTIN